MGRLNLFDDAGDSPAGGEDDFSKIEIDHEFAKRYEYNKKREELQKYEELKKQGRVDSDSDESSSEEEELVKPSKKTDIKFFDALIKVKNQDPVLRNNDAKLFNSDSEDDDGSDRESEENDKDKEKKKKKPMYLKDVVSKQLIEEGPEFDDEEMENGENNGDKNRVKSYAEEQDELRREFLKAVEEEEGDNDDEGDFIRVKDNGMKDEDEDDDEIGGKLDEYFGDDEKLDENTKFLKDFFRKKMWMDDTSKNANNFDDIELSEDEEAVERQEDYEREFNFRFEENAGDRVMGHSRKFEDSVRKKDNARKVQRERKEERMLQAEFERKEELKRLKNLKKKEINEKLQKIREVAGITEEGENVFLDEDDLEEEFDPEAHDKKMGAAFGDGYYNAEDVDPQFGSDEDEDEKPDFDKEDELLGLKEGWDELNESKEGFLSVRERILKDRVLDGDDNDGDNDGDGERKEGKRKRKRKESEVEKAVREELMEEYYKLDYEDTIGDLKTRFKYKPVKAKRYGLTPEEIFMIDEKELNQYVSLKKMAPYVEKEWKVPHVKTVEMKKKIREVLKGENKKSSSVKEDRKEKRDDLETRTEESNGETSKELSRKSKRKRRQAELKLSVPRLMAYGKIAPKSKSKKKK